MYGYDALNEKLNKCQKVVGTLTTVIDSPIIIEKMVRDDIDFILIDAEHGVYNNENAINCLQVLRLKGMPSLVRVADASYQNISRAVYMGADGIMLPRTERLDQVKEAIDGLCFPPLGRLGCGGHGQYRKDENINNFKRMLFLQIESPQGVKNLPEMIEKYGEHISAVIVGPYDLSVALGRPFDFDSPALKETVQQVFDICKSYGKSCGIFCDDNIIAQRYRDMGANVLWCCTDVNAFLLGYNSMFDKINQIK